MLISGTLTQMTSNIFVIVPVSVEWKFPLLGGRKCSFHCSNNFQSKRIYSTNVSDYLLYVRHCARRYSIEVNSMDSGAKFLGFKSWPSTISHLILGKLLSLSMPQFSHLLNGNDNGLPDMICIK